MKLHFWNKNYVGTHFGGSLYSMTDPFYMIMLIERLGPEYIVWDKSASIYFKTPGRGRVTARFEISEADVSQIKSDVDALGKIDRLFAVQVLDDTGTLVAKVDKTLYIKKR